MSKVIEIDIREALKYINDGDNNPQRIMAICADLYPKNKREYNFLNLAVKFGIVDKIRTAKVMDNIKINNLIRELTDDYAIQDDVAREIIKIWISVYLPSAELCENEDLDKKQIANEDIQSLKQKIIETLIWEEKEESIYIRDIKIPNSIKELFIPRYIDNKPVKYISRNLFKHLMDITCIGIPDTISSFERTYFCQKCNKLKKLFYLIKL